MTSDTPDQTNPGRPWAGDAAPDPLGDDSLRSQHLDVDDLSAYLDRRLDPGELAAARTHLSTCPECGQELAELRATVTLLRELPQYGLRRTFQLGPEHARRAPGRGATLSAWFDRLVPAFPALRIATVTVAVLMVAAIAGDLVANRGSETVPVLQSGGNEAEQTNAPESAPALAPAARAPADAGDQPRPAVFQESEAVDEDAGTLPPPEAETGTEPEVPASMEEDDSAEDAPGVVSPESAAEPEPVSSSPSAWRLVQVGLGLALLWLIVSLAGVAWLRRDQS